MSFTCPEDCKAYYGVNGDQLNLNEDKGTVDLKSGQKKVNYIFFLSFVSSILLFAFTFSGGLRFHWRQNPKEKRI